MNLVSLLITLDPPKLVFLPALIRTEDKDDCLEKNCLDSSHVRMVQRRVNARQLRIPLQMRPKKGWTSQMVSGLWLVSCRKSCIKGFSLVESDSLRISFPRFQGGQDQGLGFVDSLINCLEGSHLEQRWKCNFQDSMQLICRCTTKSSSGPQWLYPDPLL